MAGYPHPEGGVFHSHKSLLKTIFNTVQLAFCVIILFAVPLRAEYSNKEAQQHFENGLAYIKQGYPDLAIKEIEKAASLQPEVADAHRYLAVAYTVRLALSEAIEQYEALFSSSQTMVEVPAIKANWLSENEKILKELKKQLSQLSEKKPQSAMIHILMGWLYGEEGKLKEAHKELLHAREKAPAFDKDNLSNGDKAVASLMFELVTAMQNSTTLAKTQLDLLIFAINGQS
ncbi:MAG: hypothetical protein ACK4WF_01870 [Candidatus Brocadiales bacterium]